MTLHQIAKYRLANQQLAGTSFTNANALVAWLGAVQAQEYAHSKWSLGLRLPQATDTEIEEAFTNGSVLRTHLLRPTWHFVTPEDIRWLLLLTAPRVKAVNMYMHRKLELDAAVFNRCTDILIKELEGGKQRTRSDLNAAFTQNGIVADGPRLSYIMMQAELDGIICSGARAGNQFTYALLEERVPPAAFISREEALAELAKRYFQSRGPATSIDFATWSGLTISDARKGIALVSSFLIREQLGDKEYYFPPHFSASEKEVNHLYLLPLYDEFIMGYKNRDAILQFRNSLLSTSFLFDNTVVIDGQIEGTWKRTIHKTCIDLHYQFFKPAKKTYSALKDAAKRYEQFAALPVHLHEQ